LDIEFENGSKIHCIASSESIKSKAKNVCLHNFHHGNNEFCHSSGCAYYYGELDECMYGEPRIPNDWIRRCKENK
jgi:hypothetical protein